MKESMQTLYAEHLEVLGDRWRQALEFAGFDAAVVAAGEPHEYFLDDQSAPFRPNPHFAQWYPEPDSAGSTLVIRPGCRPALYFHQPRDFWHAPPEVPAWAERNLDVHLFADAESLQQGVAAAISGSNRVAVLGEQPPGNLGDAQHNPALLVNHLHYHRAYKTPFELECLMAATERGVAGHVAARAAFYDGASEFDTHMRYLAASRQTSEDLPYHSIVAQNRHAGVLHYQHYQREPAQPLRSFLIDAGATAFCYASDITRTYAADSADSTGFAALIEAMEAAQLALIAGIRPGQSYVDVHDAAHRAVAGVLAEQGLVRCSAEAAYEAGISRVFLPHGVGHLIGLQTHDVGGLQASPEGGLVPAPERYPALRLTRPVEPQQVFTIEPGLYFIPMLLEEAEAGPMGRDIDWQRVRALEPFGGIRIEDNVVATDDGTRNLTREAFARHG